MKFATLATKNTGYFEAMMESAERNSISVDVLGMGEEWYGYKMKVDKLSEYAKMQDPEEVVCFFDAYDVIFCNRSNEYERKYLESGKDIIIGCHERPGYVMDYLMDSVYHYSDNKNFPDAKYKYLCSGTMIGKAKWITKAIKNYSEKYLEDQVFWHDMYLNLKSPKIELDVENEFFYTSCPPNTIYRFINNSTDYKDIEMNGGIVKNTHTGSKPMLVHGPGDSDMSQIIRGLELKKDQDPNHGKRLWDKIKTYSKNDNKGPSVVFASLFMIMAFLIYHRKYGLFFIILMLLLFV